jgi:hypothetical protein
MFFRNEDIMELVVEIPEGHKHLRTTLVIRDGTAFTFQEATIANLVRAYVTVKTHPSTVKVRLRGVEISEKKEGYAGWQLLE